jgi:hypothetical protein
MVVPALLLVLVILVKASYLLSINERAWAASRKGASSAHRSSARYLTALLAGKPPPNAYRPPTSGLLSFVLPALLLLPVIQVALLLILLPAIQAMILLILVLAKVRLHVDKHHFCFHKQLVITKL